MEKQTIVRRSHRALIIVGFAAIVIVFLAYAKNNDITVTPSAISALQRLTEVTYLVLLLAFGAIGWGLYKFYKAKISFPDSSWNSIYHDKKNQKSTEWKLCGRN